MTAVKQDGEPDGGLSADAVEDLEVVEGECVRGGAQDTNANNPSIMGLSSTQVVTTAISRSTQ
jgi:hypothetical protein